jgi:ABC-type multidrug transport system fused ATPase/permease subunit
MLNALKSRFPSYPDATSVLIRRLLRDYGKRYWKRYAVAIIWMVVGAGCVSACAYLLGSAINQAYVARNFAGVVAISSGTMALFALKGIAGYAQAVTMAQIGNEITAENQCRLFDKLLGQDVAFFGDRHSSEFSARITYGASSVSSVLAILITTIGRDVLTLIGLVVVMFVRSPGLSLIGLFVMAPAVLTVRHLIKRVRQLAQKGYGGSTSVLETLQETVQGVRVVKALGLEAEMRRSLRESVTAVQQAADKLARVMNRSTPLMEALAGIAVGLVLMYGGYRVIFQSGAPGEFVSFIAAFLLAYEPGKRLARLNVDLSGALVGVRVLFDVLDLPDRFDESGKPALKVDRGRIVLRNVNFSYRLNEPVLRGLSLNAEPGQVTALVGPSGGGKSTIFNLLLHFYSVQGGDITIDGQNIAHVSAKSLREQIAYVGQDTFLFRGSVRKNIALGRIDASEDEIIAAARPAHAHEFISQFPSGYDTPVGEHGLQLSSGQRQRIAVARALIRQAPIILLDEPTASLDSESERYVRAAIRRLYEGRTTLVIAHRLYTVTHADMIYVIENGAVAEFGRHEVLLRQGNRYASFFHSQFGKSAATENSQVAAE